MNKKKPLFLIVAFKLSFFFLSISFVTLPRFAWRSDSTIATVREAISKLKNKTVNKVRGVFYKLTESARKKEIEALEQYNERGLTPLIGASEEGLTDTVKLLLNYGVDPNKKAKNLVDSSTLEAGNSALHYACLKTHVEIVKLLIKHKAYAGILNKHLDSPLFVLVSNGTTPIEKKEECIRILLKGKDKRKNFLLNQQNIDLLTPLMSAIETRDANLVRFILKIGETHINFNLKNKYGERTIDVATRPPGEKTEWRAKADDTISRLVQESQNKWEQAQRLAKMRGQK